MSRQLENKWQGIDEEIIYTVDVSAVGTDPTNISVDVFITGDLTESVKSTVMPSGSPSVIENVITLPVIKSLTAPKSYRVEVKYTVAGSIVENYFFIKAEH